MANGDERLDASGNIDLDASGNEILDDGPGDCCLRQARKCSDNTLADLWLAESAIPGFTYYVKRLADNLCYYFLESDPPDPCPGHTLIGSVTTEADCSCTTCPSGHRCFTLYEISYICGGEGWTGWFNAGNFCLPEDTPTSRVQVFGDSGSCDYQQYVPIVPAHCCTVDGDCTVAAPAPAAPVGLAPDCCGDCGCAGELPLTATAAFTFVAMCTACYENPEVLPANRISAHVTAGDINHSYTLDREVGSCNYSAIHNPGPTFHLHCTPGSACNEGDPPADINIWDKVFIRLSRTGPTTWRLIAKPHNGTSAPATLYYDSGDFEWDPCHGDAAMQSNILAACSFTAVSGGFGSCPAPETAAGGGTAVISLDFP